MKTWYGAAGVCVNEKSELLMVLEGKPEEEAKWTIPSGGLEDSETFEEAALRELHEETDYTAEILQVLKVKRGTYEEIETAYEVHYFLMAVTGGKLQIQDPDNLIHEVAWKSEAQLADLELNYPEDREELLSYIRKTVMNFDE